MKNTFNFPISFLRSNYRKSVFCVIILFSITSFSQENFKQKISIQHDNDFLFAIDRYYTAGTFIEYSRLLDGDFLFRRTVDAPIQLNIRLGQETFTPRELFDRNFDVLERPYAGYLFLSGELSKIKDAQVWSLQGEFGLAGPQSLAGEIQVAYHELIGTFIPVWEGQIANSAHINFRGKYIANYELNAPYFFENIALESTASLGTRLSFLEQAVKAYIGKRSSVSTSAAFKRIGNEKEFYGYVGVAYRYVINNAVIEGHPFGDDSPFTLDVISSIGRFESGIIYRNRKTTYSFVYHYNTKETAREGRLQYAAMTIARSF